MASKSHIDSLILFCILAPGWLAIYLASIPSVTERQQRMLIVATAVWAASLELVAQVSPFII